jgi:hypothetical protein
MFAKIKNICKSLEKEHKVRILFAVENGSRAWRMESEDSDYDVRFVFVRPLKDYLQINKPSEVIETYYDKKGKSCSPEDSLIDMVGFDVFKYTKMLYSSNPTMIEWIVSDMVYYGRQNSAFKKFAVKYFDPKALYHHYKSMCSSNYLKYLKSGDLVTYKKYLYAYRGLVNAKWVLHKNSVPPIIFSEALKGMKGIIPDSILEKINSIIRLKLKGGEKDIISNIAEMDDYIESFLKEKEEKLETKPKLQLEDLNKEIRKIVLNK